MKELVVDRKIFVIPVFVNVTTRQVKKFEGVFGKKFEEMRAEHPHKINDWKEAVELISQRSGVVWSDARLPSPGHPRYPQPCPKTDKYVVRETVKAIEEELIQSYGRAPKESNDGPFANFMASIIMAFGSGILLPRMLFTDKVFINIAFWLVAIPVFFYVVQIPKEDMRENKKKKKY
ncbi:uncharacterized protein LOC18016286 [Eutrema salsugineum]|nr:uncharacterized protein LOC18016286 [Eutrema salsugineum]